MSKLFQFVAVIILLNINPLNTCRSFAVEDVSQFVELDMLDSTSFDCWLRDQRVNYITDSAFGYHKGSKPAIRVKIPFWIVKEEVVAIGLKLVSPGYTLHDLGQGHVVVTTGAETVYSFPIPKELYPLMKDGAHFQAQTLIFTKKNEYIASRSIRTFKADQGIEAHYTEGQCFFNTPAMLASDLYENRDNINELNIDYSPKFTTMEGYLGDRTAGIIYVSGSSTPGQSNQCVTDTPSATSVSGSLYSAKEWRSQMETSAEVNQGFTLAPQSFGYVVRQDVVVVSKVQRLTFNRCGILTGRKEDVTQREKVLPAYTLMTLSKNNVNDFNAINEKLLSYTLINTCPVGGIK